MTTQSNPVPIQSPIAAIRALATARDAVRAKAHAFSTETWRFWRDLESEMDIKIQDVEHQLAIGGSLATQTVFARVGELRRALDDLLEEHSRRHIHSIMTVEVNVCGPQDSLEQAARLLWDADCGALPVVTHDGKVIGMITDRDICMACFTRNTRPSECRVESAMARNVTSCSANDSIQDLVELMSRQQLRRVPVAAPDGTLTGIVSIADVARYLNTLPEEHPARALLLPAVAAISEHRALTPASSE